MNEAVAMSIAGLRLAYAAGKATPRDVALAALRQARERDPAIWIHLLGDSEVLDYVDQIDQCDLARAPLWGVPFAVKDNVDLAGTPTTAGCPAYAYVPKRSAAVVEKLLAAGAIPIGKTNLDQFATGLVGTRSPYGIVRNAIDPNWIAGGSSSGSAVAVALDVVAFALGTDTAGSGRVPAAFNGIVGYKPSRGLWSTRGVVPACRSLDCVSVFTRTVLDAVAVARVASGFDVEDPFSRRMDCSASGRNGGRLGYMGSALDWLPESSYPSLYRRFVAELPDDVVAVDSAPFVEAGRLLYDGPWVAERYAAVGEFVDAHADAVHPVTRAVIRSGNEPSAVSAFRAQYRLLELRRQVEAVFADVDVVVTPTTPGHYRVDQVLADPLATNARLGTFTNGVNLLDLCALAIPAGKTTSGLPFGVTLLAPAGADKALLSAAIAIRGERCRAGLDACG